MDLITKFLLVAAITSLFSFAAGKSISTYKTWNMKNYVATHAGY